jgi:pimeloyl-ACP methyl ester carboxylesterase
LERLPTPGPQFVKSKLAPTDSAQFLQYLESVYDAYGNGPTVIFIGGATQHRAIDQRTTEIAKQLAAEGFMAVDYDRRGRNRSGDTPPWSLGREVEDVAALIEAAGAPAALYTSSSGAGIALAAVTEGLDVSALALYEPPYFAGSDGTEHITTPRANAQRRPARRSDPLQHDGNHRAAR